MAWLFEEWPLEFQEAPLMTDDSAVDGLVPLAADAKVGQSWDSLKKVKI